MTNPDQLRGYQLGGVDYVPVPVVPELLRAKVKVFVDLYRKTRQLERFNAELEQRVAERTAELQRFNEELEQRIEERTRERETALAQLFEAQKMDTIGQLTGGVAHDFNNLLMAVLGSLTLLEKRLPDDPRSRRLLQNAVQGAQRGAALTQRLLAFSRRQELKPEAVDLPQLVSGMDELLKRALGHGIELQASFQAALPPVLVDANQLELALLNVALNARDAMPGGRHADDFRGGRTRNVRRRGETALQPGDYVRIMITDNGVGMDEVTLAKATEPFFTTKGPGKGTGLGLSMVHGLAAQSGGLLRIDSAAEASARRSICGCRGPTHRGAGGRDVARRPPRAAHRPCKVLVVDDDLLVMTGISAMIEDLGHTSIEAHSAAEALAKLASGVEVDVVITDHAMPAMTGLQLARCDSRAVFRASHHPGDRLRGAAGGPSIARNPAAAQALQSIRDCHGDPIGAQGAATGSPPACSGRRLRARP